MSENEHRPPPNEDGIYEMPLTADDLKRELSQGSVSLLSGLIWFIGTVAVIVGIWLYAKSGLLINQGSTEKSHILTIIILLPLVGTFFNMIAPHNGRAFIRANTLVYTMIPLLLCGMMYFGYNKARTDDGRIIYTDQNGTQLTINSDGLAEQLPKEPGGKGISYETDPNNKNQQLVSVPIKDDPKGATRKEPLKATLIKNYYFDRSKANMQFEELRTWINLTDQPAAAGEAEHIIAKFQYHLGADGISFPLIILTTLLSTLAVIASFGITKRLKEYMSWFLLLEVGMLGTFTALDYLLFYIFWELVLVPMYFLIGIWGGPRKEYAALKFFLYTLFGSVFLLLGILGLYFMTGRETFDIIKLQEIAPNYLGKTGMLQWQMILFWMFFLSFAIKVPIFPFHTWLPDAHVEAPTAISVLLAGILLKMGTYGLMRMSIPTFPEATYLLAPILGVLAVINIVYGSLVAMAQTDLKKLVAYSSIAHMGFALLGMATLTKYGMTAAQLQIINHGIISGSLFLLVGVLYDRAHTRDINVFGGLLPVMRNYSIIMIIASLANLGLPGLAGFWGEFWSLAAAIQQKEFTTPGGLIFFRILAPIATIGIIVTAGYMLIMIKKIFMGPLNERWIKLPDISSRELVTVLPLIALMIYIGLYPGPLISLFDTSVQHLVNITRLGAGVPPITY
jgi:NADH-quinone oxidoreductase subunit M